MVGQQQSNLHFTTFHFLRSGLRSQSQDCCVVSFQISSSTAYVSTTMTVKRRYLHFYQHTLTIEITVATSMAVATLNQSVAPTAHVALPKTRPLSASPSVRPESLETVPYLSFSCSLHVFNRPRTLWLWTILLLCRFWNCG